MKSTLAMTASALAVLGCGKSSISFCYEQDEVKEMWNGLSDTAKDAADDVLMRYILFASDKGTPMPGTQ